MDTNPNHDNIHRLWTHFFRRSLLLWLPCVVICQPEANRHLHPTLPLDLTNSHPSWNTFATCHQRQMHFRPPPMNEYEAYKDINGLTSRQRINHLVKVNFAIPHLTQKHNETADPSLTGPKSIFFRHCIPVVVPSSDDNLILAAIRQTKQVKA